MAIVIESLNKVYEEGSLFYWCNATGDVNMPGDPKGCIIIHKPEELPPIPHELYDTYFSEGDGAYNYVVNYKGAPAYAFGFLFTNEWINETLKLGDSPVYTFQEIVEKAVNDVFGNDELFRDCYFLYGEGTDPTGCELLIVVPYEQKDKIPLMQKAFSETREPNDLWGIIDGLAFDYRVRRTPVVVEIVETYRKRVVILTEDNEMPVRVAGDLCANGTIEFEPDDFFDRTTVALYDEQPDTRLEAYSSDNGREYGWPEKG